LHECSNKVIDGSNIEIISPVALLLMPFIVDSFREIARWHLN
jgi:hypothetical protein